MVNMPESWRKTMTTFSDKVFPGLSYYNPCNSGEDLITCLPLQMTLYFNAIYFPFWILMTISVLQIKYDYITSTYQFITVTVILAIIGVEVIRLYLGYMGNLTEKIPELAAFWMLSILLQLPMEIFLLASSGMQAEPAERSVNSVLLTMLVAELYTGYSALKRAARHHTARFQELTR